MELVRVRVRRGEGAVRGGDGAELLNRAGADLVVLLRVRNIVSTWFGKERARTDVGRELLLIVGRIRLGSRLSGSVGGLHGSPSA